MHANVVDALFNAMPRLGTAVIRFNFRGVSGSQGRFGGGAAERLDAQAAVGEMHRRWPEAALLLAGYSFGAEVALAVGDPAVAGWLAVAPPLRLLPPEELVALTDQRPKHVVVGAHDQFRSHEELVERFEDAPNTRIVRVDGADHFFTIGLDQIVLAATAALQT
jgi:alpha/beta superfamily hydrolase